MNLAERIWYLLTMCAVLWYLSVTIIVAVRGAIDIRQMLKRLDEQHNAKKYSAERTDDFAP
jgi:hypothetical protein